MACVLNENKTAEYNFIFYSTEKDNIVILQENGINAEYIKINQFDRILAYLKTVKVIRFFINSIKLKLDLVFSKQDIGIVISDTLFFNNSENLEKLTYIKSC